MRPRLSVDRRTREVSSYVVLPPMPRWLQLATPARPAWATIAGLAFGLLPRWARRLYGLPALPTTDIAATLGLRALHVTLRAAPERFREGPHLRAARQRIVTGVGSAATG
jgi:uncharacterized protein (DUF2236 family)